MEADEKMKEGHAPMSSQADGPRETELELNRHVPEDSEREEGADKSAEKVADSQENLEQAPVAEPLKEDLRQEKQAKAPIALGFTPQATHGGFDPSKRIEPFTEEELEQFKKQIIAQKVPRTHAIFPVLIAIAVTFCLTASMFYGLFAFGMLGSSRPPEDQKGLMPVADSVSEAIASSASEAKSESTPSSEAKTSTETSPATESSSAAEEAVYDEKTIAAHKKFDAALDVLVENYYRELTEAELYDALTRGLPGGMQDRWTYYLSPEELESMTESLSGRYVGIGATVGLNPAGYIEILSVLPDSPAEKAGLQSGDRPVEVNGEDTKSFKDPTQLTALVRGEEGKQVHMTVFRPDTQQEVKLEMTLAKVETEEVTGKVLPGGDIGYLRIHSFVEKEALLPQFEKVLKSLIDAKVKHIIFDLRNNPGGDAAAVAACLDDLLPEGTIASIKGRYNGEPEETVWTSDEAMLVPSDMRFAILVNHNSASASELFSGCLRDHGVAALVGEQTYGKGSGTRHFDLPDGSAINVTVFRYYLPGGECIEGEGLPPQLEVSLPPEAKTKPVERLTLEEDLQLQTAMDYLRGKIQIPEEKKITPHHETASTEREKASEDSKP